MLICTLTRSCKLDFIMRVQLAVFITGTHAAVVKVVWPGDMDCQL